MTLENFISSTLTCGIADDAQRIVFPEIDGSKAVISRMDKVSPKAYFDAGPEQFHVEDPIGALITQFNEVSDIPVRGYHYFETDDNKAMVSIYTKSKFCRIVNRDHLKNHIYIAFTTCAMPSVPTRIVPKIRQFLLLF